MQIVARLNTGGVAVHLIHLVDGLRQQGHDVMLVCGEIGANEGDMTYLARSRNIEPVVIKNMGREISPLRDLITIIKLVRLMRQYRPDVVHTHTAKAGLVGRIAAWIAGVPVRVHSFHGHIFHGYFSPLKTQIFLWIERFCTLISSSIIAIDPRLFDELANKYRIAPAKKFALILQGFDLSAIVADVPKNPDFRKKYGIPEQGQVVGIVGRLVPIKNHEFFLRVAQVIAARRENVYFVIAGDGECRADLECQVMEMNLQQRVFFTGWIEHIHTVLPELDAVTLTSLNEGSPITLIEALAANVPVVATSVGGVPDTLANGEYGYLVPVGDLDGFVDALERTLNGEHVDLTRVREKIIAQYDINRMVREVETLYRRLLRK